jgi:hypothetical protein
MNLNKALDKDYEGKSFKELLTAPVGAFQGLSESDAKKLAEAFNIKTIGDLANCKFFLWARGIQDLANTEE